MEKLYELKEFLLEKKYYVIGGVIFLILLCISIGFSYNKLNAKDNEEIILNVEKKELLKKEEIIEKDECYVKVDIKGEIINPGLYQVICDSRVQDVITMAGGLTKKGDTSIINLGKKVTDEMVIIVYSKDEIKNETKVDHVGKQDVINNITESYINKQESHSNDTVIKNDAILKEEDLLVNDNVEITDTPVNSLISINSATKEQLMTLSGIGESKANNIISYRNENGRFKSIEEIKNVKGIGDSIFEKIKSSITL